MKKSLNHRLQDLVIKVAPQTHILYARKTYGFEWKYLWQTWKEAADRPQEEVFGMFPVTKSVDFYSKLARRERLETVKYSCVYGDCVVWWSPRKGNIGGFGKPGCPCDNMKDPRDLKKGKLN